MDITKFYGRRSSETVPVNDSGESESESQHTVKAVRENRLCALNASTRNMKINFCTLSFSIVMFGGRVCVMYKNVFFCKSLMFIQHGIFLANFSGKPRSN